MEHFESLLGKTIDEAMYDGENIYLLTGGEWVKINPEGDCCSSCYVQHVSGVDALRGGVVNAAERITSEPTAEELVGADVLDGWGYRLTTSKGHVSIELRLAHNGYYGGWLNFSNGEPPATAKPLDDF